ncbi:MAG: WD40/YVTN/BNR-like repeat-containing protein, partial [Terriglobales bacterium]
MMHSRWSLPLLIATACSLPLAAQFGRGPAGPQRATTPPPLQFHFMGPATGGRIASAAGVPGDPSTYYLGSASGGLWKSSDGGHTFLPIFDGQDAAAIGTIAVAPSDPNTVWVGTGEPWVIRASDVEGDGVYKSTDAGATWKNMGLPDSGRIARIVVNPTNPNLVFVCSEGHLSGEGQKGVYRSEDGGVNWKQVLFVDPKTSCSGLALDPQHPDTMLAGMWTVEEHTWAELSGGAGSGVYISHDGGLNWTKITAGMPHAPVGKVEVAIAPSNGQRMYALMQTAEQGSLWRSDDGGANWQVASWDRSLIGRAGYYFRMAVSPQNPDEVLISSSGFHRSMDGGHLFSGGGGFGGNGPRQASCGDCHDIWMDPKIPGRYALTEDGGSSISTGTGEVLSVSLPNGQMYHVASDNRVPYWLYSNRQDNGTWRGPSTVSEPIGNARMPVDTFMP